jgi:hypothetical protein
MGEAEVEGLILYMRLSNRSVEDIRVTECDC